MKKRNDQIEIYGIETNNLKDIDISIEKNGLTVIIGPSGSGKSSLAYDTIAQIGMSMRKSRIIFSIQLSPGLKSI